MIARDNEKTIGAALEVIRKYVDDMVVIDTGSTDRTPEIAASLGARVFHFPWCDDFSAARNESIRHALGQWVFWMDTDDVIDDENAGKVRELAEQTVIGDRSSVIGKHQSSPPVLGYLMKVRCPGSGDDGEAGFIEVDQVKLFRNLPSIRFECRIHEQVLMAIRRAGGTVAWTELFIVHANADNSPEGRAKKLQRDLRILQLERQERPDHPFTLFNFGMTLAEACRHEEAIGFLWQSIGRACDDESHLRKAFAFLVSNYRRLGRHVTAWETCLKSLKQFPDDAELRFRQASTLRDFGNLPDAARAFEDLLVLQNGRHMSSVDRGLKGYRAHHHLAGIYASRSKCGPRLLAGCSKKQAAARLHVTENTIRWHTKQIYADFDVHSGVQLSARLRGFYPNQEFLAY
jgi:glycosyltransferase involved in cell wall biosynthesis